MSKALLAHKLGDHLTPSTCGALWFTDSDLTQRPEPFNEIDYYLDGLLTNILLENNTSTQQKHFLTTSHFGRPFFLAQFHLKETNPNLKRDLAEVHQLALKLRFDRGNLVIMGDRLDRIRSELKIFDKDFELDFLGN